MMEFTSIIAVADSCHVSDLVRAVTVAVAIALMLTGSS